MTQQQGLSRVAGRRLKIHSNCSEGLVLTALQAWQ
jgi:hypothetical protein